MIFCTEEEYQGNIEYNKYTFTNRYIYKDTLIDLLLKIKIAMIENLIEYNQNTLTDINGYLYGNWEYYDIFKIKEYITLNLFNKTDEISFIHLKMNLIKIGVK